MKDQIKLGLFVAIGIFAVIISIVAVGNLNLNRRYELNVLFNNASGLTKKAKVKIAGVEIGALKTVSLQDGKAKLTIAINKDVTLYQNAYASIVSMGIIGTKYIEIFPGDSSYPVLKDGDVVSSLEIVSLEETLTNITEKIDSALGSLAGSEKTAGIMDNLSDAIRDLKLVMQNISSQNAKITSAINNINKFSYNLAEITGQNKEDIRIAIGNLKDVSQKLDMLLAKVSEGDGTIAKLINDEEMGGDLKSTISGAKEAVASAKEAIDGINEAIGGANKLQLEWDFLGRYDIRDEKFRSDLGINISLRKERFYYVGISNVADTSKESNIAEKDKMNTLTALLGFRSEKAEIYGGVMRNSAGVGVGYSFFDPIYEPYRKLQVHFDAFNFGREGKPPEFKAGLRYGITKWLYAGIAVEDIAYKASVMPYIKLEISDNDIASLLGIISIATVASQ